jgi:hypothetical protein
MEIAAADASVVTQWMGTVMQNEAASTLALCSTANASNDAAGAGSRPAPPSIVGDA